MNTIVVVIFINNLYIIKRLMFSLSFNSLLLHSTYAIVIVVYFFISSLCSYALIFHKRAK